jgi:serine/threonine-protein kinase
LLDFGIGKLLAEGLPGALVLQLSAIAGQPFTPAYASPEQLLNGQVELATDVFSLGVILYELLVGCRPHVARDGSPLSLRRAIIDEPALAPSAHPDAGALAPQLRGTIDGIVLKALQKRPADRHASVRDFAHAVWAVLESSSP